MKNLFLLIIAVLAFSCSTMEPAVSYFCHRLPKESKNVGKIHYVMEIQGYSIVHVDSLVTPIYVMGKLPKDIGGPLSMDSYLWDEYNRRGEIVKSHLIFNHQRYPLDRDPR